MLDDFVYTLAAVNSFSRIMRTAEVFSSSRTLKKKGRTNAKNRYNHRQVANKASFFVQFLSAYESRRHIRLLLSADAWRESIAIGLGRVDGLVEVGMCGCKVGEFLSAFSPKRSTGSTRVVVVTKKIFIQHVPTQRYCVRDTLYRSQTQFVQGRRLNLRGKVSV